MERIIEGLMKFVLAFFPLYLAWQLWRSLENGWGDMFNFVMLVFVIVAYSLWLVWLYFSRCNRD